MGTIIRLGCYGAEPIVDLDAIVQVLDWPGEWPHDTAAALQVFKDSIDFTARSRSVTGDHRYDSNDMY